MRTVEKPPERPPYGEQKRIVKVSRPAGSWATPAGSSPRLNAT